MHILDDYYHRRQGTAIYQRNVIHHRTSNKRHTLLFWGRKKTEAEGRHTKTKRKRQYVQEKKEFNDHGEESEPDLYLHLSCHFQLEEFERDHDRGRGHPSCDWGLDSSS